jgi:hypothetical protein
MSSNKGCNLIVPLGQFCTVQERERGVAIRVQEDALCCCSGCETGIVLCQSQRSDSEPPVLSLVGRRGVLCSAGRMQNCQPLSPCMTIAPWTRARARSADLSRDPSDGGRASFQISVSAAAFFPIGSTPSAYTHILIASQCICLRVCGIFLTECHVYLRVTSAWRVSCVVTHCALYQHAHKGVVAQRNYCLLMS